ncbi:MAG: AMP-binding protein, partial [Gammaproteobacteria bacterium]|nr:AMP-binding protein [Gammaproteobacteria bacterium]
MNWSELLSPSGDIALSDGERSLNYFELLQEIRIKKDWLMSLNVSVVALDMENSIDWILLDMAAMEANITLIPIPSFFTDAQRTHALNLAGVELVLTDKQGDTSTVTIFSTIYVQRRQSDQPEFPENTSKVTYTSGSTGTPKGVCLSSESMLSTAKALVK